MNKKFIIGLIFLALQVCSIIYARFVPERFFCWAPYDIHTQFNISVAVDGKGLPSEEITDRYGYRSSGWDPRSIYNVLSIIEQYEATYGKEDQAVVTVIFSINGKPEQVWKLPN